MTGTRVSRTTIRRRTVGLLALGGLVGTFVVAAPLPATAAAWHKPTAPKTRPVPGRPAARLAQAQLPLAPAPTARAVWPTAGRFHLASSSSGVVSTPDGSVRIRRLTSNDQRASDIQVLAADSAPVAAVRGPVFTIARTAANVTAPQKARVVVNYRKLATGMGGDYGSRLRLVAMPECFLTTPLKTACSTGTPLTTRNDLRSQTLTADAPVSASSKRPTVIAALTTAGGNAGTYAATPLAPSSSWNVGLNTGDFNWNYDLRTPPTQGGPSPNLSLNYNSGSVDGRVASTNSQPSWIGEGFDMSTGYIERKFVSCNDDKSGSNNASLNTGDLCWAGDNATVSLMGHSGELVQDGSSNVYRLKDDDGSRIEHVTPTTTRDINEWVLTTQDGTEYHFGILKRYTADTINTASVWAVPVSGNKPGEPCYTAVYATSFCNQAWRWNLDYVVDVHGNTETYQYAIEQNYYGENNNTTKALYTRGGYLTSIQFGQRKGTEDAAPATQQMVFTTSERCIPSGSMTCTPGELNSTTTGSWPDVPYDRLCTSAETSCANRTTPTFFTRKRLTQIQAQAYVASAYSTIDTWALTQDFPDPGDGSSKSLRLRLIQHTGNVNTAVQLPAVTIGYNQLPNRVDPAQGYALVKFRINKVITESGGVISVGYMPAECSATNLPTSPESNSKRCMPVFYAPEGSPSPTSPEYFHKYPVSFVSQGDQTTGVAVTQTTYTYNDAPAWHYSDDVLTPAKWRTYADWRGYGSVSEVVGTVAGKQTATNHTFMRGMHNDPLPGGGARNVQITDSQGVSINDNNRLRGFERESMVLDGPGGSFISGEIDDPWISPATATQGGRTATLMGTSGVHGRVAVGAGFRRTETYTQFDNVYGVPTQTEDLGDVALSTDDRCTRYDYVRNTTEWIVNTVNHSETVSKSCSATVSRPADIITDARTYYDNDVTFNVPPTRGLPVRRDEMKSWSGGPVYVTREKTTFDGNGRVTHSIDGLGRDTVTAYTPATGGPVTQVKVTDPKGFTTTNTLNAAWGTVNVSTDTNSRQTVTGYDGLGRIINVWLSDRPSSTTTPTMKFAYFTSTSSPNQVSTSELRNDGSYTTSYQIFDGLLRPRQTQSKSLDGSGGRLITDTLYDERGLVVKENGPYFTTGAPSGTLFTALAESNIPTQTVTEYDGAARETASIFRINASEKWRTTTGYGGDYVDVTPPSGGTASRTYSDVRGQTTELRQFAGATPTGSYDRTQYEYTPAEQLKKVTDPAGNVWSWEYDQLGRRTKSIDPDRGTSTTDYDNADQLTTTTDSESRSLFYEYDDDGRRTFEHSGTTAAGPVLAKWTYDTILPGQVASSSRFDRGNEIKTEVTGYDALYRPTGGKVTVPPAAVYGNLAGTYSTSLTYNVDGHVKNVGLPAVTGLPAETLTYNYDSLGLLSSLGGVGSYVAATSRTPYGEVGMLTLGNTAPYTNYQTNTFEEGTRRLSRIKVDRVNQAVAAADYNYSYDNAGNITKIDDRPAGSSTTDTQCFQYDNYQRLREAWTPGGGDCTISPTYAALGGASPYWTSYTLDSVGNRTRLQQHVGATAVNQYDYTYNTAATAQPHALQSVLKTPATGTPTTDSYTYDASGNTKTRAVAGQPGQTLTWDSEGKLASVTAGSSTTQFVYDANGDRLLRDGPTSATLYLDGTEVTLDKASLNVSSQRYYDFDGMTIAQRSGTGVQSLTSDHNGSPVVAIDNATGNVNKRYFDPFGADRGAGSWTAGDRNFVGGTKDATTGLVHLGARDYDTDTGRFVSVDSIVDPYDPQQMHGYAYANNSPITSSDPSGLRTDEERVGWAIEDKDVPTEAQVKMDVLNSARSDVKLAQQKTDRARNELKKKAAAIVDIIADVTGVKAAFDCVKGNGGCGETIINVLTSLVGGSLGRIAEKYGLPWKWEKGVALAKKLWKLVGGAIDALGNLKKGERAIEAARDTERAALKALQEGGATCNSFTGDTPVLLADGSTKPIRDVAVGDRVVAGDPASEQVRPERVTDLIRRSGPHEMVEVNLADGTRIDATDRHPFWSARREAYVLAQDLTTRDLLLDRQLRPVAIRSLRAYATDITAYNLTVDELHTYFVGQTPVLVHNAKLGACDPNMAKSKRGWGSTPLKDRAKTRILGKAGRKQVEERQGGLCYRCQKDLGKNWDAHHYPERWADGGPTDAEHTVGLCNGPGSCHRWAHSGD